MKQVDEFMPVTAAKSRFLHLIREIDDRDEVLAITRGGVPAAILLSPERYEGLLETIEILSDAGAMRSLKRSLRQAQEGRWVGDKKVFGKERA
jgi:antitoxin YefM